MNEFYTLREGGKSEKTIDVCRMSTDLKTKKTKRDLMGRESIRASNTIE